MSSLAISGIVFTCIFTGALLGLALRSALPEHHLSSDSRDAIKLGMGLIGTMAALVLGLMVSSAKSSYDTQKTEVTQMSAKIILLDRTLAHYGPETKEARELLRQTVDHGLAQIWPEQKSQSAQLEPTAVKGEALYDKIQELAPKGDEGKGALKARALTITSDLGEMRWLLFEQTGSSIPMQFVAVLVFWLTIIFTAFGMLAPRNLTVVVSLLLCALSISGALFLVLELDRPFDGLIQISSDPLHRTLAALGK